MAALDFLRTKTEKEQELRAKELDIQERRLAFINVSDLQSLNRSCSASLIASQEFVEACVCQLGLGRQGDKSVLAVMTNHSSVNRYQTNQFGGLK